MKTTRVATLNASQLKDVIHKLYWKPSLGLVSMLIIISCTSNDDIELIDHKTPVGNEIPSDGEEPVENQVPDNAEYDIIYTDIQPDFVNYRFGEGYDLDLNNDQIIDYKLVSYSGFWDEWFSIIGASKDNSFIAVTIWNTFAVALDDDWLIYNPPSHMNGEHYANSAFISVGDCTGGSQDCRSYDWKDKTDKFLGLRFYINNQIHYGWARLDVLSRSHWIIKDYAYNAIPNMPILAGQIE